MQELEAGAIANPDENRMVGHYWLRNAALAPSSRKTEIDRCLAEIKQIAAEVHDGAIRGACRSLQELPGHRHRRVRARPQFVADALGCPKNDRMQLFFFDNTDPDGIDRTLTALDGQLGETLAVVISKSGGTPETRNGMLEAQAAYRAAGLDFASMPLPSPAQAPSSTASPSPKAGSLACQCGTGWEAAPPNSPQSACFPQHCRASTFRQCSTALPRWMLQPATQKLPATRPHYSH